MGRQSPNNIPQNHKPHFQRNRLDNDRNFSDDRYWIGNPYGNVTESNFEASNNNDNYDVEENLPTNQYTENNKQSAYGRIFWGDQTNYGVSHIGKGPKNYRRSDERIKEEVCEILTKSKSVNASEIDVEVKDACVYLDGFVENKNMKHWAERMIENIFGVEDVRNNLKVRRAQSL